jgi:hypothetical protein
MRSNKDWKTFGLHSQAENGLADRFAANDICHVLLAGPATAWIGGRTPAAITPQPKPNRPGIAIDSYFGKPHTGGRRAGDALWKVR